MGLFPRIVGHVLCRLGLEFVDVVGIGYYVAVSFVSCALFHLVIDCYLLKKKFQLIIFLASLNIPHV